MGIRRQGERQQRRNKLKQVKKHKQEFYKILAELNRITPLLQQEDNITVDNLVEKAARYTDLKIANLEKMFLISKLGLEYEQMDKKNKTE